MNLGNNESPQRSEGSQSYQPYKFSGKAFSFDQSYERRDITKVRTWAKEYLETNSVCHRYNYYLLKDCKCFEEAKEFDILVKILKLFQKDDNDFELTIKDLS